MKKLKKLVLAGCMVAASAVPALAVDPSDPLFAGVSVSGLATNVTTLLVSLLGVSVLFLGYRYIKKSIARG